jgi:hypothetical protein
MSNFSLQTQLLKDTAQFLSTRLLERPGKAARHFRPPKESNNLEARPLPQIFRVLLSPRKIIMSIKTALGLFTIMIVS